MDLTRAAKVEAIVTKSISGHLTDQMKDHYSWMALVKCPDCGTEVSTGARACPKWGRRAPLPQWVKILAILAVATGVCWYAIHAMDQNQRKFNERNYGSKVAE